jgi:hypothetical protein
MEVCAGPSSGIGISMPVICLGYERASARTCRAGRGTHRWSEFTGLVKKIPSPVKLGFRGFLSRDLGSFS